MHAAYSPLDVHALYRLLAKSHWGCGCIPSLMSARMAASSALDKVVIVELSHRSCECPANPEA